MVGRSSLVASAEQRATLRVLAGSEEDAVRRWRGWFAQGGVEALRSTLAPGPSPERGERALACAREILAMPVQDRPNWTLPRLRPEIEARTGMRLAQSHLSVLLRKGTSDGGGLATA